MDVQPVLDTIAAHAARLCDALFAAVYRFDGERIHLGAQHNYPPAALERSRQFFPAPPTRRFFTGRAILDRAVVHVPDTLDLSKIEAGQLSLSLADYSMQEVAQAVIASVEALAAAKGLALGLDVAPDLPAGRGDRRRLTQVLLNLVGNAIKFTDEGGVGVQVSAADDTFHVSVRDTGPGIAPADQERIFEEFQQADTATTRPKVGTGLGLAIARRIIAMHGGRLWVESVPGEGATFRFTVPVQVERQVDLAAGGAA
jgi:signal transduction histidine kinase